MNSEEPSKKFHFYANSLSRSHFFKKKCDKRIYAFGKNFNGNLCIGKIDSGSIPSPSLVKIPLEGEIVHVAASDTHTLYLFDPKDKKAKNIILGVGNSYHGALSIYQSKVTNPVVVSSEALKNEEICFICCGYSFSVFLCKNRVVYACGYNENGQCGVGFNSPKTVSSAIPMKFQKKVIHIDCGYYFTVLLTSERDIYKTGRISGEQKAIFPSKMNLSEKVKFFRAGYDHLLVVGKSGNLYGMGNNSHNELSSNLHKNVNILTKINSLEGKGMIKDVKCSTYNSYVLLQNGELYGWGFNHIGQAMGNGVTSSLSYCKIPFKMKSNVDQVEVGYYACFVFCGNNTYIVGENDYGNLGYGFNFDKLIANLLFENFNNMLTCKETSVSNLKVTNIQNKCKRDLGRGYTGNACVFKDGSYLEINQCDVLNPGFSDMSFFIVFNISPTLKSNGRLFSKGSFGATIGYMLRTVGNQTTLKFEVSDGTKCIVNLHSKKKVGYYDFHSVAITWNRKSVVRMYIDGELDNSQFIDTSKVNITNNNNFTVGRDDVKDRERFEGNIHEFMIFKRVLDSEEIVHLDKKMDSSNISKLTLNRNISNLQIMDNTPVLKLDSKVEFDSTKIISSSYKHVLSPKTQQSFIFKFKSSEKTLKLDLNYAKRSSVFKGKSEMTLQSIEYYKQVQLIIQWMSGNDIEIQKDVNLNEFVNLFSLACDFKLPNLVMFILNHTKLFSTKELIGILDITFKNESLENSSLSQKCFSVLKERNDPNMIALAQMNLKLLQKLFVITNKKSDPFDEGHDDIRGYVKGFNNKKEIRKHIKGMYKISNNSSKDITIKTCDNKYIKVHKEVLGKIKFFNNLFEKYSLSNLINVNYPSHSLAPIIVYIYNPDLFDVNNHGIEELLEISVHSKHIGIMDLSKMCRKRVDDLSKSEKHFIMNEVDYIKMIVKSFERELEARVEKEQYIERFRQLEERITKIEYEIEK